MSAADLLSYDGWYAWRLDDPERTRPHDLRVQLSRQPRRTTTAASTYAQCRTRPTDRQPPASRTYPSQ
jgi:hypothetical protein